MEANLLKLKRKHPFWFALFYQDELDARKTARQFQKLSSIAIRLLKTKADEYWGWDIDRDAYDACTIAHYEIERLKNKFENELS